MKKIFVFFLITILLTACGEDCYNPPLPIVFEFVDSNGENLITNGTLTTYTINEENQTGIELSKTDDDKILLENVGAYNGTKNYNFFSNIKNFDFSIESSEFKGGCDGYQINKLTFTGIDIDVIDANGYYKIVLQ
ncbi:membrane lipoprotein lipid attachment site-containing protein [Chryseobacterium sp. RLHN22]|uniref:membrane lipoprotein lipid attachment site-containing protein n=1 Tax=Chryseobacterium sp. RLHN22 TaxID=3437885 RepID=UPI003D9B0ABB